MRESIPNITKYRESYIVHNIYTIYKNILYIINIGREQKFLKRSAYLVTVREFVDS